MAVKRKRRDERSDYDSESRKKAKVPKSRTESKPKLIFAPRPDWHAAELPPLDRKDVATLPPQRTSDDLHTHATSLLETECAAYNASHLSGSASHKFLSTIMSSGTLEDKVSALTLLVQESPLHAMKAFENLLGLARKKSRNQALMAVAALKDLLGQGVVLPDRKLRTFANQPGVRDALNGKMATWQSGEPLPSGLQQIHLVVWAYEDWLKRTYFQVLQVLESWLSDEVTYSRSRALTFVWELLKDKPEQEENLLRLLVNKLGDTDRKIASRASYLLLQLEITHPAMKTVITGSIEADCLFRPGQSMNAKYYAVITLNQTILSVKEEAVANKLLDIYFTLFLQLLKPVDADVKPRVNAQTQGGGGKAGKAAAKKDKALEKTEESEAQLREKLVAQVLTGVNRAFPFADTSDPTFEKQMDTIFRVTHSANFNTSIQALMLIQQISSTKHYGAERFYRTLYESLLDPRLLNSSKQVMYLNLVYKALKSDLNAKRVQAFLKRLLQIITLHEPAFACGVLFLVSELEHTFPSIRNMMTQVEEDDEDGEEHFADVQEEGQSEREPLSIAQPKSQQPRYDGRKRDPDHAHAERSCLWDVLPLLQHFHPSVSIFAHAILFGKATPQKPDPTHNTLMHFLDRFVYRSARSGASAGMHGNSIMQPMAGSHAVDLLFKPSRDAARTDLNSESFWQKKVQDIAADEVFFHSYFNQAGSKKRRSGDKKAKQRTEDEDDEEASGSGGEAEIWKAITNSKPEVEGLDEDDDISMGDLESSYFDSEDGSEAGIDLGGDDGQDAADIEDFGPREGSEVDDMEDMLELESEDDAMFDDEDELPEDFEAEQNGAKEEELSISQTKRRERKKLKSLPTFASAEYYAKMLEGDDDEEDYT